MYTRAIRGDYVVVPPHIYIRELMLAVINQRSLRLRILIGAFVPKAPDTLNPNGDFIIRLLGLLTEPVGSCETGALQGPLHHKSILAVKPGGEPAAKLPSPPDPPNCTLPKGRG